jgi:hypothetical protein
VVGGVSGGGSFALRRLIGSYGDEIAADLLEVYQFDLRDVFVTSPKWVLMLITQLPVRSRFYAARRGGAQFRDWDETRYLLVAVANSIRMLQWTYVASKSKRKPPAPDMIPVPDQAQKRKDGPGSFAHTARLKLEQARQRRQGSGVRT